MPGHDLHLVKCEPPTEDVNSQPTTLEMWYHAEPKRQTDHTSSHLLHQLHGTLEDLAPAPAGPAATPVEEHLPSLTQASLATLQPAPVGNTMGTTIIDMHAKMMNVKEVADSAEFVPLMAVKEEQTSEGEQQQSSDDTSDSTPEHSAVGRGSPKAWSPQDMDSALEALRTHNMTLTKASATFGIPSTTLWQRAHRLGIDTPKKDGASKSWSEEDLKSALQALRAGTISANKASKAYGIPSSTLYKIARREGIRLAAPFNAAPTAWRRADLTRALAAVRAGAAVQRAAAHYGIPTGTLYGRCKREGIELSRSNPTPWSEDAMEEALEAVRVGQMSINQAAIHFNLPYSSLYGRFKRCKMPATPCLQPPNQVEFSEQMNGHYSEVSSISDMEGLDDLHRTYTLADVLGQSRPHADETGEVYSQTHSAHLDVQSRIQAEMRLNLEVHPTNEVQSRTQAGIRENLNVHPINEVQSQTQADIRENLDEHPINEVQSRIQFGHTQINAQSRTHEVHTQSTYEVQSRSEVPRAFSVRQALYALEPCGPAYCDVAS